MLLVSCVSTAVNGSSTETGVFWLCSLLADVAQIEAEKMIDNARREQQIRLTIYILLYVVKKYRQRLSVEKLSCIGISLLYFNVYLRQHFVFTF